MNTIHFNCSYCNKSGVHLKCSRCMADRYCDSTCQRADWTKHKQTCEPSTPEYLNGIAALKKALVFPGVSDLIAALHHHTGKVVMISIRSDAYVLYTSKMSRDTPAVVLESRDANPPSSDLFFEGEPSQILPPLRDPEKYLFWVSEEGVKGILKG